MVEAILLSLAINHACLIRQIIVESEGEPMSGKATVAEVIRERSRRSGLGYCAVIAQPGQFGDREISPPPRAVLQAVEALWVEPECSAVHFDVRGNTWAHRLDVACYAGSHVFYEERAWRG